MAVKDLSACADPPLKSHNILIPAVAVGSVAGLVLIALVAAFVVARRKRRGGRYTTIQNDA